MQFNPEKRPTAETLVSNKVFDGIRVQEAENHKFNKIDLNSNLSHRENDLQRWREKVNKQDPKFMDALLDKIRKFVD